MVPTERRESYRALAPLPAVKNLRCWLTEAVPVEGNFDVSLLEGPRLNLGRHAKYSLLLGNISATGLNLRLVSPRPPQRLAAALAHRKLFIYLGIEDPDLDTHLDLLLLGKVVRAQPAKGGVVLGVQFLSQAKFIKHANSHALFDISPTGVNKLAAWTFKVRFRNADDAPDDAPDWLTQLD